MASSAKNISSSSQQSQASAPTPELFFETAFAYQKSAALKTAVDLNLFTAIAEGNSTPAEIGRRVQAAERGVRILCDYLTIHGFLTKQNGRFQNTPASAAFLSRTSPTYIADAIQFLNSYAVTGRFSELTAAVRNGGTTAGEGSMEPEAPMWLDFARTMGGLMVPVAEFIAGQLHAESAGPWKVLDIAAGHGVYGLTLARRNPRAQVYAVDWAPVLEIAQENAHKFGVADRFHRLPGSAFDVDLGRDYDVALMTNFLHHFDPPTNEKLLRKVHAAMKPGSKLVTVEFVPNDDRISPPMVAAFSLSMLSSTRAGDAYTFAELEKMFRNSGFGSSVLHPPVGLPDSIIVTERP